MFVGVCEIELLIYDSNSLKEKRSVIKSVIRRLSNRFNISIAEIGFLEEWNRSLIAVVTVSNNKKIVKGTLSKSIDFIDNDSRIEIINKNIEIM